jgi:hypothetical protein
MTHDFPAVDDYLDAFNLTGEPCYTRDAAFVLTEVKQNNYHRISGLLRAISLQNIHNSAGDGGKYDESLLKQALMHKVNQLTQQQKESLNEQLKKYLGRNSTLSSQYRHII